MWGMHVYQQNPANSLNCVPWKQKYTEQMLRPCTHRKFPLASHKSRTSLLSICPHNMRRALTTSPSPFFGDMRIKPRQVRHFIQHLREVSQRTATRPPSEDWPARLTDLVFALNGGWQLLRDHYAISVSRSPRCVSPITPKPKTD
jgi:hypothetical protein